MRVAIQIRAGEGGMDAKLLCERQATIYIRYAENHGLNVDVTYDEG